MLGLLDRTAARCIWTAVCVLLLVWLLYVTRETLFIFVVALLFAYLLWPLVKVLGSSSAGAVKAAGAYSRLYLSRSLGR